MGERLKVKREFQLNSDSMASGQFSSLQSLTTNPSHLSPAAAGPKLELQFPVKRTKRAEVHNCPKVDFGNYVYERDTTIRELTLSGNSQIFLSDSTIPLLENQFKLFLTKEDFPGVESLRRAPSVGVISVTGLDNLSNLKRLSISYCPELCDWSDKTLPLSLQFLKLKSCDKLSSLPLLSVQKSLNTLNVLSIINCPWLSVLDGFHGLMELQTVELLRCRKISISPSTESLPAQPYYPHILIGDCPLLRDWCQRNSIKYYELNSIANPQDDREDEVERSIREFLDKI